MSSDLLAEFDNFYRAPQGSGSPSTFNPITPASNAPSTTALSSPQPQQWQTKVQEQPQWETQTTTNDQDIWGGSGGFGTKSNLHQPSNSIDHDPWGSFESPATSQPPTSSIFQPQPQQLTTGPASNISKHGPSPLARRSTLDLFSNNFTVPSQKEGKQHKPQKSAKDPPSGDVLFDAEDETTWIAEETEEVDDDDFGDFETGEQTSHAPSPPQAMKSKPSRRPADLLSTDPLSNLKPLPYPQAPKSPSFQERNPFADLALSTKKVASLRNQSQNKSASPVTAWPTYEPKKPAPIPYQDSPAPNNLDDDWGDFADLPSETPGTTTIPSSKGWADDAWSWDAVEQPTTASKKVIPAPAPTSSMFGSSESPANVVVPTNIPPPSVLLPVFAQLFNLPQTTLFQPVSQQSASLKTRILSDPSAINFLRSFILISTVAAHIIAGRKLRWKRDTMLSQAMKIGPAAAGGKGGMKLTGVDKAETAREDREATDIIQLWKEQVGKLKSAVAIANTSIKDPSLHLTIPDISEAMVVRTASTAEGGLTAPKVCLLCGLKREERVVKVDVNVEDSFGDWWVDHWGHRACRNFWEEHESKLKQR
jgi:hypothetical protein